MVTCKLEVIDEPFRSGRAWQRWMRRERNPEGKRYGGPFLRAGARPLDKAHPNHQDAEQKVTDAVRGPSR